MYDVSFLQSSHCKSLFTSEWEAEAKSCLLPSIHVHFQGLETIFNGMRKSSSPRRVGRNKTTACNIMGRILFLAAMVMQKITCIMLRAASWAHKVKYSWYYKVLPVSLQSVNLLGKLYLSTTCRSSLCRLPTTPRCDAQAEIVKLLQVENA